MMRCLAAAAVAVAIAAVAAPASAGDVPGTVAFSARILRDGLPVKDQVTVRLSLFRSGDREQDTTPLWTEVQTPTPDEGLVALQMGTNTQLSADMFDGRELYLEIAIAEGDVPTVLGPRLAIASVPYAMRAATAARADYATETAAVPAGAVMHFDLTACPPGWAELPQARGRTIVGGAPGGGPVGAALADREDRAHTHGVLAQSPTSRPAGAHGHGTPTIGASEVPHTHGFASPIQTEVTRHNHVWASFSGGNWLTHNLDGTSQQFAGRGFGTGSAGVALAPAGGAAFFSTSNNDHSHQVRLPSTDGADHTSHTHSISLPVAPDHQHVVEVVATNTLPVTTSQVMPYVQLLVCRKMGPA